MKLIFVRLQQLIIMVFIMAIILIFEAKETKNKTSFPLNNIHDHQVDHMKHIPTTRYCFLMIRFKSLDEVYLLPYSKFEFFWDRYQKDIKNQ